MVVIKAAPLYFNHRERHINHCIGGWMGPSVGLGVSRKSRLNRDSIPGPSSL